MPLPNYFQPHKNSSITFEIGREANNTKAVEATSTATSNLFVISGSGIETWKIDRKDFPEVKNLPWSKGEPIAIAVVDKPVANEHGSFISKMRATAIGLQDGSTVTLSRIKHEDGRLQALQEPISVKLSKGKINPKDAEKLSASVISQASAWEKAKERVSETSSTKQTSDSQVTLPSVPTKSRTLTGTLFP
jgi:hypothetical protein